MSRGKCCSISRITENAIHAGRSEEHTSELQSHVNLVCRLLLEKKKKSKLHRFVRDDHQFPRMQFVHLVQLVHLPVLCQYRCSMKPLVPSTHLQRSCPSRVCTC